MTTIIDLCSCGHSKGCHSLKGTSLCQLKGCGCRAFCLDAAGIPETPASRGESIFVPIKVAGDWI